MSYCQTPTPDRPWALSRDREHMMVLHPPRPLSPPQRCLAIEPSSGVVILPDKPRDTCGWHKLRIYRRGQRKPDGAAWLWDGNVHAPTLHPSIQCLISGWHGFLRSGRMEEI